MEFKVGDIVIGKKSANKYNITSMGWKGKVVDIKTTQIKVEDLVDFETYYVDPQHFELVEKPFPEKWYIKITVDNEDVLKQYYDTLPITFKVHFTGYMSNVDVTSDGSFLDYSHLASACLRKNCTEITFEQFKTHVLKETMEPKKEDLTGRYLKYIGSSTKDPEYGDYFRIDSMEINGLFRLKDKTSYVIILLNIMIIIHKTFEHITCYETNRYSDQIISPSGNVD
jgi:hypothetical protein